MTRGKEFQPKDGSPFSPYLPRWVRRRLPAVPGEAECIHGAVLYADLAGFTTLAEMLAPLPDGAERLDQALSRFFTPLVEEILAHRGDVARFAGDSLTAVFATVPQAAAASAAMQQRMPAQVDTAGGAFPLRLRVGIGAGELTWQIVGTIEHGLYWVVAGPALLAAIAAEQRARPGEVIAPPNAAARAVGPRPRQQPAPAVPAAAARHFLPPPLLERLQGGLGAFVGEYRRVCPAFVELSPAGRLQDQVATALSLVEQFGGRLNEVEVGDKGTLLILLFGAPPAHEDDPVLATGCLLALQEAGVLHRAGLTMGTLFVGEVGAPARHGYTAVGREMNLACGLMQAATPGEILVSRRVQRAIQHRYTLREQGSVGVKGRDLPVPVAVPLEARPEPTPQAGAEIILQDRREELAWARESLQRAVAGRGMILRISGEAGVGKTRLAQEVAYLAQAAGMAVLTGSARADRQAAAYAVWREPLARLLETLAGPEFPENETAVAMRNPAWAERIPLLGDVLGRAIPDTAVTASFDAPMRRLSTQSLVVDLFRWKAHQGPLCLLLDDLHWADALSLELLVTLARWTRELPLLLLLVHRPLGESAPVALQELPEHTALPLAGLGRPAAVALVCARAADLPAETSATIADRGGGNPLFLEALTSIYRETGSLELPQTVHGVIQAHIDRLTEAERLTLKTASVLGRAFRLADLQAIHPLAPNEQVLREHLDHLIHLELMLPEHVDPLSFAFKHILIQEVAYASLLYAQRQALHAAAGRWYEQTRPDDSPLLAYHWERTDLDEPAQRRKARQYCQWAGEQLAARFANAEAVALFTRALTLTPPEDREARFALLLAREELHDLLGQREAQQEDLSGLHELATAAGETVWLIQVQGRRAAWHNALGEYEAAIAAARAGLALVTEQVGVPAATHVGLLNEWGQALQLQRKLDAAEEVDRSALAIARSRDDLLGQANSLRSLGALAWNQGHYAQASAHFEQALALYQAIDNRVGEAHALNNLGVTSYALGDFAAARDYYERSLAIERAIGNRAGEASRLGNLGLLLEAMGDYGAAQGYLRQSLPIRRAIGERWGEAIDLFNSGGIAQALGDYRAAWDYREQALLICRAIGDRNGEGQSLGAMGTVALETGDHAAALSHLEQALEILRGIGDRRGEAYALCELGRVHLARGATAAAATAYTASLEIRREIGQESLSVDAAAGLARTALQRGDLPAALVQVEGCLDYIAQHGDEGVDQPLAVYQAAYQVLSQAGRHEQAAAVLERAHRLLQDRAQKITDPTLRQSFLENVAVNREILAAWGRHFPHRDR